MIIARRSLSLAFLASTLSALSACVAAPDESDPDRGVVTPAGDPFDIPIQGATAEQIRTFFEGDDLFGTPLHEADGLGPLYTRSSCGACHDRGARGPGSVQKMSVVEEDGVTASADQSLLPWGNTVHPLLAGGATTPVLPPDDPRVRVSVRVGPPILGRGYLEAVDDAEILRAEAEQANRDDGIHGRVHHVVYLSEPSADPTFNPHQKGDVVIGRFGLKARIATLEEFTADALQGDMGITSPLRPTEPPNPDGLDDDKKPGVDVGAESVSLRAMYMRLTAIPRRPGLTDEGARLFERARCAVCHQPSMRTRADYPMALLAGIDAPIFTDMLIHDMGDGLADGVADFDAGSRDYRTAPLIGLRFVRGFLHDGRAATVEEAIRLHGGEAAESAALFAGLSVEDRATLVAYVGRL